jgi:hypothetical protein
LASWHLLVVAGEIGVVVGFAIAAIIALSQIRQLHKKLLQIYLPPGEKKND